MEDTMEDTTEDKCKQHNNPIGKCDKCRRLSALKFSRSRKAMTRHVEAYCKMAGTGVVIITKQGVIASAGVFKSPSADLFARELATFLESAPPARNLHPQLPDVHNLATLHFKQLRKVYRQARARLTQAWVNLRSPHHKIPFSKLTEAQLRETIRAIYHHASQSHRLAKQS